MTTQVSPVPVQRFYDNSGNLAVGGLLYTYAAGTTTPQATYTSSTGATPNTNPIVLNSRGECQIWCDPLLNYKYVLTDALSNTLWTVDNVQGLNLSTALSAPTGSSLVGFHSSTGRTVEQQLDMLYYGIANVTDPKFAGGAVAGASDSTAAIQAAVNSLPSGGFVHGQGQSFSVSSVLLQSNMTMFNITLVELPGTTAFRSPITIDGTSSAKTNIRLSDVTIDGNRSNQTNIIVPSAEDGGLHGIRCIGTLSNLYLERVTAKNCGSYGMILFSSTSVGATDSTFVFNNIVIRDSFFTGNRAHGLATDSTNGLRMSNVKLTGNGNDLNGTDPLTYGTRGATTGGVQYGNGFDMEGYGLGSGHTDMRMENITATGNARMGGLFFDQIATRPVGFSARQKIWISNSYFDAGISSASDGSALQFTSTLGSKTLAALYDSVYISNTRLDGTLLARCVNNLQITGGAISSNLTAYYCTLDYATNIVLGSSPNGTATLIYAANSTYSLGVEPLLFPANPVLTNIGPAGTLANIVCTPLENIRDRTFRYLITADWTISAPGGAQFRITPSAGVLVSPPRVDVISSATAVPIVAAYYMAVNYAKFIDPGTGLLSLQFVVDVKV